MRLEHWPYIIPLRLRSLFLRRQVEEDLDDELQYHLERKIEQYLEQGLTPEEARYAARRDMQAWSNRKSRAVMRAEYRGLSTWCRMFVMASGA